MDEQPQYTLSLDGVGWNPVPGVPYLHDYEAIFKGFEDGSVPQVPALRALIKEDLWFLVYFVLKIPIANNAWWVKCCNDVQLGPSTDTLDLWARFHGKSTIITVGDTIQRILKNPEERICLFSWKLSVAKAFFNQIKRVFEENIILRTCFNDVLWGDPSREATKWSEDEGIYVRRRSTAKEPTLMAAGLIEGSPTGYHFSGRLYDDIMTEQLSRNPDMIEQVKNAFDMSQNLKTGTSEDWQRIIGTPYAHNDVLMYIRDQKDDNGVPLYTTRLKPATVDGTPNGASVYLPEAELAKLRANKRFFYSQQLLDPTPLGDQRLDYTKLIEVSPSQIPQRLFKFMAVDPAGMRLSDKRQGDSWSMVVAGVEPYRDDVGNSRVFILDIIVEPMTEAQALKNVVDMFVRNGMIRQIGIEKVGISSAEVHIAKALFARGRALTVENGGLCILRPAGRAKEQRIEAALSWPLLNQKLFISTAIQSAYRERVKLEMQKFPFWHDDALDSISYIYDMIRDFRFGVYIEAERESDEWDKAFAEQHQGRKTDSWLYV